MRRYRNLSEILDERRKCFENMDDAMQLIVLLSYPVVIHFEMFLSIN